VGLRLRDNLLNPNQYNPMKLKTFILCLVALGSSAPAIMAQQPRRVAATVVLLDSITQPGAPFVLVRRPGATPADLILVHSEIGAAQLSDAIRGLLTARQANGDFPNAAARFRVRPQSRTAAVARPAFPWAQRVLNDLRRAEPREIHGVGRVRAVEIWLPRQGNGRAAPRT
jgi:hypothetical protein